MLLVGVGLAAWCAFSLVILVVVRPLLHVSTAADRPEDLRVRRDGLRLVGGNQALGEEAACPACEMRIADERPGWDCPACGTTLEPLPRIGLRPAGRREGRRRHGARG